LIVFGLEMLSSNPSLFSAKVVFVSHNFALLARMPACETSHVAFFDRRLSKFTCTLVSSVDVADFVIAA